MEVDPTRVCALLVGLGDVEVLGIDDEAGAPLRVRIRRRAPQLAHDEFALDLEADDEEEHHHPRRPPAPGSVLAT